MAEFFKAKLSVRFNKDAVYGTENYNKDKLMEPADSREIIDVEITATSMEQLKSKLNSLVELVEK